MLYRVVKGAVDRTTKRVVGKTETVWEGKSLLELEAKFPRLYFTNGNTLDQLRMLPGQKSSVVFVFLSRKTEQEKWEQIDDPRYLLIREPGQRTGGLLIHPSEIP